MKKITKLFSMILVFTMLLVSALPTSIVRADEEETPKGSIKIDKAIDKGTYNVYKILTLETYDKTNNKYIYRVTPEWSPFITSGEGANYLEVNEVTNGTAYVTWRENADEKAFAKAALKYAKETPVAATQTKTANGTVVEFTNLDLGYYLVDSSIGALCNLKTTDADVTIYDKNGVPVVDKKVLESSTGEYETTNKDYIGETISFKTTIDVKVGAENYVLHDTMSEGLTLNQDSIKAYLGKPLEDNSNLIAEENYTVTYKKNADNVVIGFEIAFDNDYTYPLTESDDITVIYSAVLNEDAVIAGDGNTNETYLTYGDNPEVNKTPVVKTTTYTYSFDLVKTDEQDKVLTGAQFRLYKKVDNKYVEILLVKDEERNAYRVAYTEEDLANTTVIEAGSVEIIGLDGDTTYYLEETVAPEGYNKLTSYVEFKIESSNLDAVVNSNTTEGEDGTTTLTYVNGGVEVENKTGTKLPETGGMGTVLFMTIGSLLVLGFGVLLVTKLRMSKISA